MPSKPHLLFFQWLSIFLFSELFSFSHGDVGTASFYRPPYLPTACYGNNLNEIPTDNLFGAASVGIWDNGASCGRQYLVRCLSAAVQGTCVPDQTIQIKIVDRADSLVSNPSTSGTTIVLSTTAYDMIANSSAASINIEFQQV